MVDFLAETGHLALGDALDISLLNDYRQRLLDHAPGLQKARNVGAFRSMWKRTGTAPARVSQSRSR